MHGRLRRGIGALCAAVLLGASEARGDDGVIEINQARALAGAISGSLASDPAGFPVVITQAGSYVLTGNLTVPDSNTTAIRVQAASVQIDLGGFEIQGPNTCSGSPTTCTASGPGIGIQATSARVSVRNGVVRGMGAGGVALGDDSQIVDVVAAENGGTGLEVGFKASVVASKAIRNGGVGISALSASSIRDDFADLNALDGIRTFGIGTIEGNIVSNNGEDGIDAFDGGVIRRNYVHASRSIGLLVGGVGGAGSLVGNTTTGNGVCGIVSTAFFFSGASDNTSLGNPQNCGGAGPSCCSTFNLYALGCNLLQQANGVVVRCCPDPPNPDICY